MSLTMRPRGADDTACEHLSTSGPSRETTRERGAIGLLLMGFVAILVSVVLVGIDTTSLHLARIETLNASDAAARGAADALSDDSYYGTQDAALDPAAVDVAARDALARQVPSSRIGAWQVTTATRSGDGRQATVVVTSQVRFGVSQLVRDHLGQASITVESTARGGDARPQP